MVGPPSLVLPAITGHQYALEFLCHFVTMVTAHISHISWLTLRMTRGMAQKKNSPTSKDLLLSLESVRI